MWMVTFVNEFIEIITWLQEETPFLIITVAMKNDANDSVNAVQMNARQDFDT